MKRFDAKRYLTRSFFEKDKSGLLRKGIKCLLSFTTSIKSRCKPSIKIINQEHTYSVIINDKYMPRQTQLIHNKHQHIIQHKFISSTSFIYPISILLSSNTNKINTTSIIYPKHTSSTNIIKSQHNLQQFIQIYKSHLVSSQDLNSKQI